MKEAAGKNAKWIAAAEGAGMALVSWSLIRCWSHS